MWIDYQYVKLNGRQVRLHPLDEVSLASAVGNVDGFGSILAFLRQWDSPDEYVQIKTSGSTGSPKIINARKEFMVRSAIRTCHFFKLVKSSVALLCLPATYIAGQMMIVRAIVSGFDLLVDSPKGNPAERLQCKVDFSAMVPNQVITCLQKPQSLNNIRSLIIGGGKVGEQLSALLKSVETNCYETFGMTETLSHIAVRKVSPIEDQCFTTLDGISVKKSEQGTLVVDYPDLEISGMCTNDIVEVLNSNVFRWCGRADFVINSGGIKISPEDVERDIARLFPEMRFCISSRPDAKLGNKLVLVAENLPMQQIPLLDFLKANMRPYYAPKEIFLIDTLPTNAHGKLDRRAVQGKVNMGISA